MSGVLDDGDSLAGAVDTTLPRQSIPSHSVVVTGSMQSKGRSPRSAITPSQVV